MNSSLTGPVIRPKSGKPLSLMVLLHGYGSDGNDLIGLAPYFADLLPGALFVAPNAPEACGLGFGGYQWFALDHDTELRGLEAIATVRPVIGAFLQELWVETGLGPNETILAGFSQGAMIALDFGLGFERDFAAVLAFSGGIPPNVTPDLGRASTTPVCLVHGDADPVVPLAMSQRAEALLAAAGRDVRLHISQNTGHGIAPDGLMAAREFLAAHLPPEAANRGS